MRYRGQDIYHPSVDPVVVRRLEASLESLHARSHVDWIKSKAGACELVASRPQRTGHNVTWFGVRASSLVRLRPSCSFPHLPPSRVCSRACIRATGIKEQARRAGRNLCGPIEGLAPTPSHDARMGREPSWRSVPENGLGQPYGGFTIGPAQQLMNHIPAATIAATDEAACEYTWLARRAAMVT